jgi:xanthine/CO dehydrogenase XdhC/CoxF family maturation factor
MAQPTLPDPACAMAHGELPPDVEPRTLVAVFVSPVTVHLLHFGRDLGYRTVLVEPEAEKRVAVSHADHVAAAPLESFVDGTADVVVADHDRPELGHVLRDVLALPARWVGVMGSPRHTAPHLAALRELGVDEADIARVHRPIGLNIGSRTPPEIAVATLAGLIADRNHRPGGFGFSK